jgi:hypothetical protein
MTPAIIHKTWVDFIGWHLIPPSKDLAENEAVLFIGHL